MVDVTEKDRCFKLRPFLSLTIMPQQRFAPNDLSIPDNLRERIELWDILPPKSQFQQYGPLTGFLSIKFPQSHFIVKPQALLREIWEIPQDTTPEDVLAIKDIILGVEDHTVDADEEFKGEIRRRLSIDSQGFLFFELKRFF